ncbi:UNVERIFIED_CONTAM: hypothetical protein GTU68_048234 [Idotea baltica]|nr:hypothetical protein [Idotea baltica]
MPVKIRLARRGRKKRPYYHIIIADSRSPRDGKFIETIGSYNPMTSPATIEIDHEKALEWMEKGAQPTETARSILRFKGVLYKKHLNRGVKKGAFSEEKAEELWNTWITAKDEKINARKAKSAQAKLALPQVETADVDAAEAFTAEDAEAPAAEEVAAPAVEEAPVAVEETPAVEEAPAVAEAPASETPAEEVKDEADTSEKE